MNQYKKMIALVLITAQVLTTSYGQSLKGKYLVGGNGWIKLTKSSETSTSRTGQKSKDVNSTFGVKVNGLYAYAPAENVFLGVSLGLDRTSNRTIKPIYDEIPTIQSSTNLSGFVRLIAPFSGRFRPYADLGVGYNVDKVSYDTDKLSYQYGSIFVKPSVSFFNKDYTRSFDFSTLISRIFIENYYEVPYVFGLSLGYNIYF